jgi:hypothetical protein
MRSHSNDFYPIPTISDPRKSSPASNTLYSPTLKLTRLLSSFSLTSSPGPDYREIAFSLILYSTLQKHVAISTNGFAEGTMARQCYSWQVDEYDDGKDVRMGHTAENPANAA